MPDDIFQIPRFCIMTVLKSQHKTEGYKDRQNLGDVSIFRFSPQTLLQPVPLPVWHQE